MKIPALLETALDALYGHYEKTFRLWEEKQIPVPPCFIIVCNNTSASKLVYDYISGFHPTYEDGSVAFQNGRLGLFRNFDDNGEPLSRPRTLLIDSEQLESGEGLDDTFRSAASDEIEHFRREQVARTGQQDLSDSEILRGVMNTVGKAGDSAAGRIRNWRNCGDGRDRGLCHAKQKQVVRRADWLGPEASETRPIRALNWPSGPLRSTSQRPEEAEGAQMIARPAGNVLHVLLGTPADGHDDPQFGRAGIQSAARPRHPRRAHSWRSDQ